MGVLYLTTKAGKLKLACVFLGGALAGMSTYAHEESPWNWDKYGFNGYLSCMEKKMVDEFDTGLCAHPFMEQLLVGASILSVLVTVISLLIYCLSDDDFVMRKLRSLDYKFHIAAGIFLVLGVICYGGSAALIQVECHGGRIGRYCSYLYRVPEKYLTFAMGIPGSLLYFYTAKIVRRQDSHVLRENDEA